MKNKILNLTVLIIAATLLSSCDKDTTEGYTRMTYYPTLELLGEDVLILAKGDPYVDAGFVAILNGEDINDQVEVISDVDVNTPGKYVITYQVENADGFSVSSARTIYVADPTPSPIATGMHDVVLGTHRINENSGARTDYDGYEILILQTEPGVYFISDFLGGYYDQRAGYGANYAMTGSFRLNEDNTVTVIDSNVAGWGDSMDEMTSSSFDPETGELSYSLSYAGFLTFNVIIN